MKRLSRSISGETAPSPPSKIGRTSRDYSGRGDKGGRYNYVCTLDGLELNNGNIATRDVQRRGNRRGIFDDTAAPRPKDSFRRFRRQRICEPGERAIAYQAYRSHPDFIMNTGDNVYEAGLASLRCRREKMTAVFAVQSGSYTLSPVFMIKSGWDR